MQHAAKYGMAVICPDTSPRGCGIPGEDDAYDFGRYDGRTMIAPRELDCARPMRSARLAVGSGAGFYIDATVSPWSQHYKMESYIMHELLGTCKEAFPLNGSLGIFGHSMGGHGALTLFLKNPSVSCATQIPQECLEWKSTFVHGVVAWCTHLTPTSMAQIFSSVSAFSPICKPTGCPWGEKAFKGYLGSVEAGAAHDATVLIASGKFDASIKSKSILVDQGNAWSLLHSCADVRWCV